MRPTSHTMAAAVFGILSVLCQSHVPVYAQPRHFQSRWGELLLGDRTIEVELPAMMPSASPFPMPSSTPPRKKQKASDESDENIQATAQILLGLSREQLIPAPLALPPLPVLPPVMPSSAVPQLWNAVAPMRMMAGSSSSSSSSSSSLLPREYQPSRVSIFYAFYAPIPGHELHPIMSSLLSTGLPINGMHSFIFNTESMTDERIIELMATRFDGLFPPRPEMAGLNLVSVGFKRAFNPMDPTVREALELRRLAEIVSGRLFLHGQSHVLIPVILYQACFSEIERRLISLTDFEKSMVYLVRSGSLYGFSQDGKTRLCLKK